VERIQNQDTKQAAFGKIADYLTSLSIKVDSIDDARPWGGFFVMDESFTDAFVDQFFPGRDPAEIKKYGSKLSPKILLVQPGEKLSWQYHNRRAEIWKIVQGPVGIVASSTDTEQPIVAFDEGQIRQFEPGERHRLVGLQNWGVVAEIWQHTDPNQPSNEDDIVRLSDNYGR
jgi:mannose-6-phosphate isomerase-like protein (cupin superfamily)